MKSQAKSYPAKKTGIYPVIAAIAIQLTLGIAYLWSLFQNGIAQSIFDKDNAKAQLTFSLLLATLTIGSVFGGKLAAKYSTRFVVFIGGIILSAGFFLASFVTANTSWSLWVTYGLMGGVGMGFTYSTTIACAQKWYPHKKGLVTGIIVSALGFGGVVFTPVIEKLIKTFGGTGTGEQKTFLILSGIFLFVCTIGSLFMKNPPEGFASAAVASSAKSSMVKSVMEYTPSEMLKSTKFYLIVVTFILACMGGLMMIGFAKPIALDKGLADNIAYWGVLAVSMFNSLGRLIWGVISDRIGRKNTIIILLSGGAVLPLFVTVVPGIWIFVLIAFIGFFYGGLLSTFPSLTADLFGAKHMATNYGFVLLGFGSGAILSSQISGYYKDIADKAQDISLMFPAFVIASCCAGAGIIMMLILKGMSKRERAAANAGQKNNSEVQS
ncbi:MAG: OFA family MFS transporter [Oscillospiraceae bacterium]|nr:OFA family MFS transporter [Oscillospiraceae bacterium]